MKNILRIGIIVLRILCVAGIIWFVVYFFFGHRISLTFKDREFAEKFPQILVFLTSAGIYGLFILSIKSSFKKWKNLLLFFGGLALAFLPFLIFHGILHFQCGAWNQKMLSGKTIYVNQKDATEVVKVIKSVCEINQEERTDTLMVKQLNTCLEVMHDVVIEKSENGNWTVSR